VVSSGYLTTPRKLQHKTQSLQRLKQERLQRKEVKREEFSKLGFKFHKIGGCFVEKAGDLKKRYLPRDAMVAKFPYSAKNYIGVELEMCSSISRDQWAVLLAENKLTNKINIHGDSSIRIENNNLPYQIELAILDTEDGIKDTLHLLQKALDNPNYDFAVNTSCGTHVHLVMRNRDHHKAYQKLYKSMSYIISLASSNRKDNTYCVPNIGDTYDDALSSFKSRGSRYQVINPEAYQKYRTLEIRVFEGTLDMNKVCNWIDCLVGILNTSDEKAVLSV
jgi:hypothetical protein